MYHATWGTQVQLYLLKVEVEAAAAGFPSEWRVLAEELPVVLQTPAAEGVAGFPSEWRVLAEELPVVLQTPAAEGVAGLPSEGRIPAEVVVAEVVAVAVAHQPGEKVQCGSRILGEAAAVRSRRIQRIWIGPESAAALTLRLQVDGPRSPSATSRSDRRARRLCEQAHSENSLPPPTWWPELWGTALHPKT
jgi:hypothetical protein